MNPIIAHRWTRPVLTLGALLSLAAGPALARDLPAPGQYEVTTRTTYTSVPLPDATVTTQNCLTAEDLEQDPASVFADLPDGKTCNISNFVMADGEIEMAINCDADDGKLTMITTGTFDDDGYDMVSDVVVAVGEQEVKMQTIIEGKLLGDC
ncbi:MAG: DUF3617 domain-containing protein [Pseudomonadota bacterium]